jgi:hypothetical protein
LASHHGTAFVTECAARRIVLRGLGLTFRVVNLVSGFISGKVDCLDGGKCRDKLIAYTSVFAAVKVSEDEIVSRNKDKACRSVKEVCR